MVAIKYVKDVGRFSYESGQGYSNDGIDLRSCEYFSMLRDRNFNFPAPCIRNDLYVSQHQHYARNEQNQRDYLRQRFSTYPSTYQYQ